MYLQHDPLQKRTEKYSVFPLRFAVSGGKQFGLCHYVCGVVKTLDKIQGIDEILVFFKYKFNLHTTVRCKVSIAVINPLYRSTIYTYAQWRRFT